MTDLFEQLLAAKWRDVEFPVTRMRMSLAHDLVEHKYWGVDGARVEATGLAPIRFSFSAPLTNGIVPGKGERWSVLYPNQFRALVAAFQQKTVGVLQHPEFGEIACKAERLDIDWDAGKRGGVDAELSFVETKLPGDANFLEFPSPVQEIELAALNLDASETKADLKKLLADKGIELPEFKEDLFDLARKIQAVIDAPTLLQNRLAGRINSIVYRYNKIAEAAARARDAATWPVARDNEKVKGAAHNLRDKLLELDKAVGFFRVPADTTLAGVARQIPGSSIDDLVRLNPALLSKPVVTEGTTVRHYVDHRAA